MADAITVNIVDRVPVTRQRTDEGFIRGRAGITRTGVFVYDAAELGVGPSGKMVKVERTRETVFHDETIRSLTGAPITLGHPENGEDVTPENWRAHVVGNIVGTPQNIGDTKLEADVLVGDAKAIEALNKGIDEMSVGYKFNIIPAPAGAAVDYLTTGPLTCNHAAVVELGRAGHEVRIYDKGEETMTDAEMKALAEAAAAQAVAALNGNSSQDAIAKAVADAMAPMATKLQEMQDKQAAADKAAEDKAKETQLAATLDEAMAKGAEIERTRQEVWRDAEAFIPEAQRDTLRTADIKEILVAAVGDSVPNAKDADPGYLRGVLVGLAKSRTQNRVPGARTGLLSGDHLAARDKMIEQLKAGPKKPGSTE